MFAYEQKNNYICTTILNDQTHLILIKIPLLDGKKNHLIEPNKLPHTLQRAPFLKIFIYLFI